MPRQQGAEVGMGEESPLDVHVGLAARQPEEQREEHERGEGEADLAAERKAEPEAGPAVPEDPPQVELVAQATHRVDDPEGPHGEDPRQHELHPPAPGARVPGTRRQEATVGRAHVHLRVRLLGLHHSREERGSLELRLEEQLVDAVHCVSYFNFINRVLDGLGVDPEPAMRYGKELENR